MDDFVELLGLEIAPMGAGDPFLVGDATRCDNESSSFPPVNADRPSGAYGSYCVIA